jgi:hypothetical protein
MTAPNFQVQPTPAGFTVTAGSNTAEFAFGQTNPADERKLAGYDDNQSYDLDIIRNSRGEFRWEPRALVKLRMLGLFAGYKADGSAIAQPDPIPFLIAAGIVQAPQPAPTPATKKVAATLEQIKFLPGAKEFPEAAFALAEAGLPLDEAQSVLAFALHDKAKNSPNRSCNSQFGLVLQQAPN